MRTIRHDKEVDEFKRLVNIRLLGLVLSPYPPLVVVHLHVAVAVNALQRRYPARLVTVSPPPGRHPEDGGQSVVEEL
jgi:hypothetical protein